MTEARKTLWSTSVGQLVSCAAALALWTAATMPAYADGYFLQTDVSGSTVSAVGVRIRNSLNYSANFTNYDGGKTASVAVLYTLPIADFPIVKIGPTFGVQQDDSRRRDHTAGIRFSVEKYSPTSFGAIYLLSDVSSSQNSWFVLGQLTFDNPSFGLEVSRGGSDTYSETTVALQRRLGDGPVSLRIGYKATSQELFAGVSINTF